MQEPTKDLPFVPTILTTHATIELETAVKKELEIEDPEKAKANEIVGKNQIGEKD